MEYRVHIDAISMYFDGFPVDISLRRGISVREVCFLIVKQCGPFMREIAFIYIKEGMQRFIWVFIVINEVMFLQIH